MSSCINCSPDHHQTHPKALHFVVDSCLCQVSLQSLLPSLFHKLWVCRNVIIESNKPFGSKLLHECSRHFHWHNLTLWPLQIFGNLLCIPLSELASLAALLMLRSSGCRQSVELAGRNNQSAILF